MTQHAIEASGLVKRFGSTEALAGLDLVVESGTVMGLLGPNGAGKTTCVRVLTTLLRADAGSAIVAGHDVVRDADRVRRQVGLAGQYATVDELLTGRQNLVLLARLFGRSRKVAASRSADLLERFELTGAADRPVSTYSGGMRRRLDLAASVIGDPTVVVLDEPTTGLDPRSRVGVWDLARELVAGGATLLLTTQYLEEADRLCDRIAVVDAGRIVAEGTASELKRQIGGVRLDVDLARPEDAEQVIAALGDIADGKPQIDDRRLSVPVKEGFQTLVRVVRRLDQAGVNVVDVAMHEPSLDDVFLTLTGRRAAQDDDTEVAA